jgi:Lysine-specific metallo-endopeptidase
VFFSEEFAKAGKVLRDETFTKDWTKLVETLRKLATDSGPSDSGADALTDLRKRVLEGPGNGILKGNKKVSDEAEGILYATGDYDPSKPTVVSGVNGATRDKAATLKLLRHLYFLRKRGSHKVWICSLPDGLKGWPSTQLAGADISKLKACLIDTSQRFSDEDKKHLSNATQEAMKWVHKAMITLTTAAKASGGKTSKSGTAARAIVKRWFDDGAVTAKQLDAFIGEMSAGFKKIATKLNGGQLVLTDHPEYRGDKLENSEAFVWQLAYREKLEVVYIEKAFFGSNNVLKGLNNWARILVHELTHLDVGTQDKAYAWEGIKPGGGFPFADAKVNAESWAFFCADAAGALSESDRGTALQ